MKGEDVVIFSRFQHLRLTEMSNAVLVQHSENMIEKIRIIEPYVTWGYPSLRSIHDLIFKYGKLYDRVSDRSCN